MCSKGKQVCRHREHQFCIRIAHAMDALTYSKYVMTTIGSHYSNQLINLGSPERRQRKKFAVRNGFLQEPPIKSPKNQIKKMIALAVNEEIICIMFAINAYNGIKLNMLTLVL
uniref:Uncharacterized protein n=1 Tax=Glossina austeni TaxID=7395 RepID=A0A1A9UFT5_GLOAU